MGSCTKRLDAKSKKMIITIANNTIIVKLKTDTNWLGGNRSENNAKDAMSKENRGRRPTVK